MSRSYNISDFAAFLRKHGGSGQDRVDRDEIPYEMAAIALFRNARGISIRVNQAINMAGRERSTVVATASTLCGNRKSKPSPTLANSA